MRTRIAPAALAALTALGVPALADARGPKKFTVSLTASTRMELSRDQPGPSHFGCVGRGTTSERFDGSASVSPKPKAVPLSRELLRFNAKVTSRTASASQESIGFANDPDMPGTTCDLTPGKRPATCEFAPQTSARAGAPFLLFPYGKWYVLAYETPTDLTPHARSKGPFVTCTPDGLGGTLFYSYKTKLRVNALKRLGVGRSISVSETQNLPAGVTGAEVVGKQSITYKLKVRRVR